LHCRPDAAMTERKNRRRLDHAPETFAVLIHIALGGKQKDRTKASHRAKLNWTTELGRKT
jgi:predicted transposase YbfD/YdcC